VLATSNVPLHVRLQSLWLPGVSSGLIVLLVIALRGLAMLRGDRVLAVTLAAWLGAGAVGVLGGGSYWPHYLIELVAPASLLTGAALASVRARGVIVAALAAVAVVATVGGVAKARTLQTRHAVVPVAHYVRDHARPGDTQYVLYARANVGYYTGLPAPTRTPGACSSAPTLARSRSSGSSSRRRGARPGSSAGSAPPPGASTPAAPPRAPSRPTTGWSPTCTATRSTTARPPQGVPNDQCLGRHPHL
jgi:hypothetical protein